MFDHFYGSGCIVRFIEFMDVGNVNFWDRNQVTTLNDILSIISTGGINHRGEIGDFLESTFLGHSTPKHILTEKIDQTLNWLIDERFIRKLGIDEVYTAKRADSRVDGADD